MKKKEFDIIYTQDDIISANLFETISKTMNSYSNMYESEENVESFFGYSKITKEQSAFSNYCTERKIKDEIKDYKNAFKNFEITFESPYYYYQNKTNKNKVYIKNENNILSMFAQPNNTDILFLEYKDHLIGFNIKNNETTLEYQKNNSLISGIIKKNKDTILKNFNFEEIKKFYNCLKLLKLIKLENSKNKECYNFFEENLKDFPITNNDKLKSKIIEISDIALLHDYHLIKDGSKSYNFIYNKKQNNNFKMKNE